ncbi:PEP-CTERM sorting domain-containing protein [Colwellia sp. UCD-KL20]|uniref:PEP-CTERM sorting domain-containing protein n=1 Tax=Colwellia sp. UCD-KL20 TaxID=1917165 RepID=UPI0009FA3FB3|nr:PEP-CTERM sorting domain-containing protein [Colwellia sp. UCD-KL20]
MLNMKKISSALLLASLTTTSQAALFFGEDLNPLVSSANSDNANAAFLAQLSGVGTEDFESFSQGISGPLTVDFGVAGTATLSGSGEVRTSSSSGRFATSGSAYWNTNNDFTITFSNAISAFGFYGTDIGDFGGNITLDFVNGSTTSYIVNNTTSAPNGSLLFWGLVDVTNPFTSITFGNTNSTDVFGFDDMTIGTAQQVITNSVPEPGSLAILGLGLAGFSLTRKAKKQA